MRSHSLIVLLSCLLLFLGLDPTPSRGQTSSPEKLTLVQGVVCEDVKDGSPQNVGIAFPVSVGKVTCFTDFDPVPRKTAIYQNWFRKDELNAKITLVLQPPRWATYSTIQLREIDKGPWRVEITDQEGQVLGILRFSITD
jgi:Protein of unknown function (DUF2914)